MAEITGNTLIQDWYDRYVKPLKQPVSLTSSAPQDFNVGLPTSPAPTSGAPLTALGREFGINYRQAAPSGIAPEAPVAPPAMAPPVAEAAPATPGGSWSDKLSAGLQDPAKVGLLGMGLSMMATPPRQVPYSGAEIIGNAGLHGLKFFQQAVDDKRKQQSMDASQEERQLNREQLGLYRQGMSEDRAAQRELQRTTQEGMREDRAAQREIQRMSAESLVEARKATAAENAVLDVPIDPAVAQHYGVDPTMTVRTFNKMQSGLVNMTKPTAEEKAPTTRKRDVGSKEITEEWKDGAWTKIGEAPRWNERGGAREDRMAKNQQFRNERDMRQDFEKLPEVKNYNDMNIKASQMTQAIEESKKTNNFVAVDQALITMFNKMTDPNSVVRESEYARTSSDIAFLNKIKGKAQAVASGGAGLTSDERNALKTMSDRFLSSSKGRYDDVAKEYQRLAKTYGYEPNNIVFRGATKSAAGAPKTADEFMLKYRGQ